MLCIINDIQLKQCFRCLAKGVWGLKKHGFIPNVFIGNPPLCFVLDIG